VRVDPSGWVLGLEAEMAPGQPADVREAALAVRAQLLRVGLPPRGPDGACQVLVACRTPRGLHAELLPFPVALEELGKDPDVRASMLRQEGYTRTVGLAVVLLAIGKEGAWWCASIGAFTHRGDA
jgi:hypothetical protein